MPSKISTDPNIIQYDVTNASDMSQMLGHIEEFLTTAQHMEFDEVFIIVRMQKAPEIEPSIETVQEPMTEEEWIKSQSSPSQ